MPPPTTPAHPHFGQVARWASTSGTPASRYYRKDEKRAPNVAW
jgi:hypothetical protein